MSPAYFLNASPHTLRSSHNTQWIVDFSIKTFPGMVAEVLTISNKSMLMDLLKGTEIRIEIGNLIFLTPVLQRLS